MTINKDNFKSITGMDEVFYIRTARMCRAAMRQMLLVTDKRHRLVFNPMLGGVEVLLDPLCRREPDVFLFQDGSVVFSDFVKEQPDLVAAFWNDSGEKSASAPEETVLGALSNIIEDIQDLVQQEIERLSQGGTIDRMDEFKAAAPGLVVIAMAKGELVCEGPYFGPILRSHVEEIKADERWKKANVYATWPTLN
jgi:hypothetical protein